MKVVQLEKNITSLNLDKKIIEVLNKNDVNTVKDLWILTRKNLKEMGLNDHSIYQIIVNLQLMGIDLNKKVY